MLVFISTSMAEMIKEKGMTEAGASYKFYANIQTLTDDTPLENIQTTSLYHNQQFNAMLFVIPAGHVLKEHVSPKMLTIHVISGRGHITIGNERFAVKPSAWFYIEPNIPHELLSDETLTVLLNMVTVNDSTNGVSDDD